MTAIDIYFTELEHIISISEIVELQEITLTRFDDFSGTIKGKIYFRDTFLNFMEVIYLKNNSEKVKKRYAYNYMTDNSKLIFRYDNAPNHRNISTFPHHKHLDNCIIEANEPNLNDILFEIEGLLK